MKKPEKGKYGYLNRMRRYTFLKAVMLLIFAFAIFLFGKLRYPAYSTMFGITAVVVCIPAAMTVVSFVMFVLHKTGPVRIYDTCEELRGTVPAFYDSVITTTQKSYGVNVFICANGTLAGYSEDPKMDTGVVEKHIREMAAKNDFKSPGVKIFTDFSRFQGRLSKLASDYGEEEPEDKRLLALIANLSL